ncbi:MAG: DUF4392 domain-containing protein [Candidatus Caldarchaeum sp.]
MNASEYVDKVVSVDYNARGVVEHLHTAARKHVGKPLCMAAAEKLENANSILIITGFRIFHFGSWPETDGLVSACLLSACMELFYGKKMSVAVDEGFEDLVIAGLRAAGSRLSNVYGLPLKHENCLPVMTKIFQTNDPDVVVFIERPGANRLGVYHNAVGQNVTSLHAPADVVVNRVKSRDVTVVAYGDGGNEAGMGVVSNLVEKHIPYGAVCTCGCGGGIVSNTPSDILVVSAVSDFGVYGTLALMQKQAITHVMEKMHDVVRVLVDAGCVDARKGPGHLGVDGLDLYSIASVVQLLSKASRSDARRL